MEESRPIRVLIVDDDRRALAALEAVLAVEHSVVTSTLPLQALELARAAVTTDQPFEVVCSDFRMPEMDGGEFLRRVATLPEPPSGILVTGYAEVLTGTVRNSEHILGIVTKPYDPDHLLALVGRLGRVTRIKRAVKRITGGRSG